MGLARRARAKGIDLRVCAPGLIPRKPTDRIKTDARDAERLVRQLAAGGLSFVRVPSEQEEALRDLVRAREDVRQDLSRARHRLSKMLLCRGLRYDSGSTWTDATSTGRAAEVRRSRLADRRRRVRQRRRSSSISAARTSSGRSRSCCPRRRSRQTAYRLRCFRGLATLSAVGLCCEIGDFRSLHQARQAERVRGPGPDRVHHRQQAPAGIDHQGRLQPRPSAAGRSGLAHRACRPPASPSRAAEGIDPRVIAIAWRAQVRLHKRYTQMKARNKPAGVITIANARELACFCWEAATLD